MKNPFVTASEALSDPLPTHDEALEQYARAVALLTAAERARLKNPCDELERAVLAACDLVLARRVRACRCLLELGIRLPRETVASMLLDEQVIALPVTSGRGRL
jgi:hypothetical protein